MEKIVRRYFVKKMNNPDFSTNEHLNKDILFCVSAGKGFDFPMVSTIGKISPLGDSLMVKGFTVSLYFPSDGKKITHSILGKEYFGKTPYGSDPLPKKDCTFYNEFDYYEFIGKSNVEEMKDIIGKGVERIIIEETKE